MLRHLPASLCLALLFTGCDDVEEDASGDKPHSHGLVTRLGITFTPDDGGDPVRVEWADPELDGDPIIDPLILDDAGDDDTHVARTFSVELDVWNDLEDPPSEVTPEILELGVEHWFFFTGSATESSATEANPDALLAWEYADEDAEGLPLGLINDVSTVGVGEGELVVTLRHLVPNDGQPTKVEGLDALVAADGFSAIPGGNDIQVVFPVDVQ